MKSLNKAQEKARADIVETLRVITAEIEQQVSEVNELIAKYNDELGNVEELRDEIVGEMEAYYEDRSEKWQEGEKGQNYSAWKDQWEVLDITPLDDIDAPDLDLPDELENLPSEPEESW